MSTGHLVDITVDPADESRRRRRALLRIGLPIGGVALIIAVILGIALYSHQANRAGVLRLSDGLLREMQGRIALQVVSYLEPATRAAQFVRALAADSALRERIDMAQAFAATALTQLPQVDAFDFADAEGNFMMVRHGDGGGIDTKLIRNSPGARQVTWIRRDAAGREIARQPDPTDSFDPRTRTWFTGASNTDGVFWSDVYVFYTSESPGVTAAVRYLDQQGRVSVFGVDIALKALSEFLASLRIGRSGRAVIMDGRGTMVAMGDMQRMLRQDGSEFVPARIDQVGDAELTAAYDRYRVTGYGRNLITVGDRHIVSIVAPLRSTDHDWSMVIV
ncbi:MAG TPA: cache domain-containing protein, partial [Acetobacteraceae bacterium]|nr:cache domain-containing protein [Acetobacteraceae bacterium]